MKKFIIGLVWITLLLFFAGMIYSGSLNISLLTGVSGYSSNSYEAVFLANGQVYFGKVSKLQSKYVKLIDIYYLIQKQPLQAQQPAAQATAQPEFTLIKLGGELHGPMDQMMINKDQILFIEELKSDSKVVQAINNSKSGK